MHTQIQYLLARLLDDQLHPVARPLALPIPRAARHQKPFEARELGLDGRAQPGRVPRIFLRPCRCACRLQG